MKNPLSYQKTEYDCGPATLINGVSCLFEREEIPPEVIQHIMLYSMDACNSKGEFCKGGTSGMAMMFLSSWLNRFGREKKFPIHCEYLSGGDVCLAENSRIVQGLRQGGVAAVRLRYGCWHYVLLTGAEEDRVELFDPYYREKRFRVKGVEVVADAPMRMNRRVAFEIMNREGKGVYAFGPPETREAVLLFNSNMRRAAAKAAGGGSFHRV